MYSYCTIPIYFENKMGVVVGGGGGVVSRFKYISISHAWANQSAPPSSPIMFARMPPPKKSSPRFISQSYFSFFHFPVAPVFFFFFGFAASHTVTHTHLGSSNVKVLNGVL